MINRIKKAFTLTEVLIAVAIVGVIAALVLPIVITTYQSKVMDYMAERQEQSLKSAMAALTVTENKSKFSDTMMSKDAGDDTSGKFLKKYLRVSRYYGTPTVGELEAFAPLYYKYEEQGGRHVRTEVKRAQLDLKGSCAQLKNGASICITTQQAGKPAQYILDLNGPKGPNIVGRDLRVGNPDTFEWINLPVIRETSADRGAQDSVGIIAENETPVAPVEINECTSLLSDASTGCCKWKRDNNRLVSNNEICCTNTVIGPTLSVCAKTVEVHLNYYPTSVSSPTKPYTMASSTFRVDPAVALDTLPSILGVKIKCSDGTYQGGVLSGSTIKSALQAKQNAYWPTNITKSSCAYPKETLLWDNNGSTTYTYNGVTYKLFQH